MKLGIRGKLFLISLLLVCIVILTAGLYLESAMGEWLESRIATQLETHAATGRSMVQAVRGNVTTDSMDPVADLLGRDTKSRITIIAKNGRVLGDSRLDGEELNVDNHGQRPEVIAAHADGLGISKRFSNTLKTSMLYVAMPYHHSNGDIGTVRAAMSIEDVREIQSHMRWVILISGFISLLVAISMAGVSAHLTTRTLRRVLRDAKKRAEEIRINRRHPAEEDEISGLISSVEVIVEELEKTLEELAGERSRLEAVLEGMDDGVVALDRDLGITLMNRFAQNLLSIEGIQHRGKHVLEIIQAPQLEKLLALANSNKNRTPQIIECDWRETAKQKRVMAKLIPMRSQPGWILVLQDVTELRRLERVRQDFVANVSHELRTPISVVQANSQTLINGAIQDEKYAPILLDAIERNAQRLTSIISDLLELSQLEAKQTPLITEELQLIDVVRDSLDLLAPAIREKELEIKVSIPNQMFISANQGALNKIMNNLLDNAIKYNSYGASIQIKVRRLERQIRLEVVDDGPGVPEENRSRLFERFYRVDTGRSRKIGGTGLGLSLVKHLAEKMGGEVGMEPVSPHGCLFWITLPKT
ncbi:MAG: hypothetical protein HQL67_05070 [Magnetococcales bacterium]|nr:hypothetical protein [Magnetococcales bacterium]